MTLPVVFTANGPTGYNLTKSLRFRSSASAYLNRTPASSGSSTSFTYSVWVKRGIIGGYQAIYKSGVINANADIGFNSSNQFFCQVFNSVGANYGWTSTAVFRDPSAWYHIVIKGFASSSGNSYGGVELALYVNGVQQTFTGVNYASPTTTNRLTDATAKYIGIDNDNSYIFDGYLAEFNYVDGQSLNPSSFGSTNALTGVWQPAKYTGTYGTNGFYLPFTNTTSTTTLGYDFSGNSNNWTTNNISLTAGTTYDSMTDVPTLTSATTANYSTWNPLVLFPNTTYQATMSNANMLMTRAGGGQGGAVTTIGVTSGKFYAEMPVTAVGSSVTKLGVVSSNNPPSMNSGSEFDLGGTSVPASIAYRSNGARLTNGTTTNSWGSTYTTGDVIGVAFDADTGKIWFAKNNTWQASGDPAAGTNPATTVATGAPFYFSAGGESGISISLNCGQQPFVYTPPTGFVALNTYNLPISTIVKGNTVMDATLYTGNSGTQSMVNTAGFKPDFVWLKSRSNALDNGLFDSVRGVQNVLASNGTGAANYGGTGELTAFNSNGFTLVNSGSYQTNQSGYTYVGWQWQAGQGSTSSNTSGSITSTVSVNASAGFSVVTYTGTGSNATVGHGLGVAPSMIITKRRSGATENWGVYHISTGSTAGLFLNLTDASLTNSTFWNNTSPTSSVFSVGSGSSTNPSAPVVAYCWSEIAGFSKFGSYTGNGSSDGPFVYTNFRPRWIMIKNSSAAGNGWVIMDSSRDTYNQTTYTLYPNSSGAETNNTTYSIDILSNGFKVRASDPAINGSSNSLIYAAFAENPFKNALAR